MRFTVNRICQKGVKGTEYKINNTKDAKNIIKEHCKSHLQKYQIPVKFTFTDNELFSERYKKIRNR